MSEEQAGKTEAKPDQQKVSNFVSLQGRKFDEVTRVFGSLIYMNESSASLLREIIVKSDAQNILELGFYHGKSSSYIAAILEDRGTAGHLTTIDLESSKEREPNIYHMLDTLGLAQRVTPVFAQRSYTWELARMLQSTPRPQFDFCYFDGGHTWDFTGLGLLLVDMLLKPGGIIVLDDVNWSLERSFKHSPEAAKDYARYDADEISTKSVLLAMRTILPHLGYKTRKINRGRWAIARKLRNRNKTFRHHRMPKPSS